MTPPPPKFFSYLCDIISSHLKAGGLETFSPTSGRETRRTPLPQTGETREHPLVWPNGVATLRTTAAAADAARGRDDEEVDGRRNAKL